jgi:hypothetical protein
MTSRAGAGRSLACGRFHAIGPFGQDLGEQPPGQLVGRSAFGESGERFLELAGSRPARRWSARIPDARAGEW